MRFGKVLCMFLAIFFASKAHAEEIPVPSTIYVAIDGTGDYNCNGTNDDVEINLALDFAYSNAGCDTVYLKGPATYLISAPLYIGSGTTLTGDSTATIKLIDNAGWPLDTDVGIITSKSGNHRDITISGFAIDGNRQNNQENEGQNFNTILFSGTINVHVHDMHLHDYKNSAMKVTDSSDSIFFYNNDVFSGHEGFNGYGSSNLQIFNNSIINQNNYGIRVDSGNNVWIYDNEINGEGGEGYGIQVHNDINGPAMNNIHIYNNIVHSTAHAGIWAYTDKNQSGSSMIRIHHNIFYDCGRTNSGTDYNLTGGVLSNGWNMYLENNVFDGCYGAGLRVRESPDHSIPSGYNYYITLKSNIISNSQAGLYNNGEGRAGYGVENALAETHTINMYNNCVYDNAAGHFSGSGINHHGTIYDDPLFADREFRDYHLKSQGGRWNGMEWVTDSEHSPCIDTGYALSEFSNEPEPNGGRINMGRYGNTPEASKSIPDPMVNEISPLEFSLSQNIPNPFNPETLITYQLPGKEFVTLKVYNINGQEVDTLVQEIQESGFYSVRWSPEKLSSGMYFYRIIAGDYTMTKKMIYMR